MIARLLRNPAAVVLVVVAVAAVFVAVWAIGTLVDDRGMSWSEQPTEEQLAQLRLIQLANVIPAPATVVAVFAVLGVIVIGAVTSRASSAAAAPDRQRTSRSTRTMSAAGSTEKRAAVTTPNFSPSISNS